LLFIGACFRINGLTRDSRLHSDEALFASYSRIMVIQGDWLLDEITTDKPPTTYLLVGMSLSIWGENEFAVRLPNVFASLLGLATFYALAKSCSRKQSAALIALLLWVVSPIEIGYAPTAFQDPPMLLFALLSAWMATRHQWKLAGLFLGLAIITKPTGLWLSPLIIALGILIPYTHLEVEKGFSFKILQFLKNALRFLIPFAIPILLIYWWDQSRTAQSFIEIGGYNNNPGRFIRSSEVIPRLEAWLDLLSQFAAYPWLAIIFLLAAIIWLIVSAYREPSGLVSWAIAAFMMVYMAIYWLIAFSTWDRYVLPIAPFALIVSAQGITWLTSHRRGVTILVSIFILMVSWQPAINAVNRSNPPGADGLPELADTLNRDYVGQIVYDNWLGWYLYWYLGGYPQVQVVYFPTPEDLADHLQDADGLHYFVAPSADTARPWLTLLNANDILSTLAYQSINGDFVLYRLIPPQMPCEIIRNLSDLPIERNEKCAISDASLDQ
jgi:4-amino-4-deoxy-L-arabinose transferase-like glycosyltransferase